LSALDESREVGWSSVESLEAADGAAMSADACTALTGLENAVLSSLSTSINTRELLSDLNMSFVGGAVGASQSSSLVEMKLSSSSRCTL
jgi:hypothetical protein